MTVRSLPPPGPVGARPGRPSGAVIALVGLTLAAVLAFAAAYALGLGPFAPTPAPPSGLPTVIPSQVAPATTPPPGSTAAPPATTDGGPGTASPTFGPVATASPSDATARLLLHIPQTLRPDCVAVPGVDPVLATATCHGAAGQITLTYLLYLTNDEMSAAYDGYALAAEIERDTGNCRDPETWPAETEYRLDQSVAGRLLCMKVADQATIYWTDERLSILALATDAANDQARLWRFWLDDSGPDL